MVGEQADRSDEHEERGDREGPPIDQLQAHADRAYPERMRARLLGPPASRNVRLRFDLFEEARLQELLAVDREERVDAVADDAHHFALTPARVTDEIALLERPEHRALHALDLECAATPGGVAAAHGFLEELLAHLGLAPAARSSVSGVATMPPVTWTSAAATARVCSGGG